MAGPRRRWWWFLWAGAAVAAWAMARGGPAPGPAERPQAAVSGAPFPSPNSSQSGPRPGPDYDPARFAPQVRVWAGKAGVSPQLVMAILYNESYKPHDPDLERAWQRHKPDSAFGIANMHRAAFDEAKQGRDFAARRWEELPDDQDLAIEAAAWHLHDLAGRLPDRWPGPYDRDELLALGYNAGAGNMDAFARGATPGSLAQSYLDRLRGNWSKATAAVGA